MLTLDDRLSGIYCIENLITHKKYIGQSNNMYIRQGKHINELNKNIHENDYLQKAWNKYGKDNFNFYVWEYCDIDNLDEKEDEYKGKAVIGNFPINLGYTDVYGNPITYNVYYTNIGYNSTGVLFEVKQGGMV